MTYARFEAEGGVRFGVVEAGTVREIPGFAGEPAAGARSFPLSAVRLLAPCAPSKIFALAFNYTDHLAGRTPPKEPQVFLKVPSSLAGPGDTIVLPPPGGASAPGRIDEEGELVVVIGTRARGVSRSRAMEHVLGFTCGNDVSARGWQKNDLNWWRAKSSDTFSPIGPVIVTGLDPRDLLVSARINGTEVQSSSPKDLLFDIPFLVEWISSAVTLEPGDLIFTGTSGAPAELHDGDVVEVEIGGIGVLKNLVRQG
jgi:2-keto-4-pentenoate hydratase/2-oxohepta-3-ene-1,7-dioic acid hydratase in catechol pathway